MQPPQVIPQTPSACALCHSFAEHAGTQGVRKERSDIQTDRQSDHWRSTILVFKKRVLDARGPQQHRPGPDTAPLHHTLAHTQRDPTCSPTMETRKIPDFAGTWVMKSSENFDELLKKLGKWRKKNQSGVAGGGYSEWKPVIA